MLNWSCHQKRWGFGTCKGIQDSLGFWIPRNGFRIPGTGFRIRSQWNFDSGFQSFVGLRIPWDVYSVFQSLGFRISEEKFFSDSGIRNPLLERQITLSGNLRTKQEYLLCSKLCSTIWTLHRKIFWKKILIMENDLVIKSRISEVLSQLKAKPSGHPPSNLYQIWQFYAFPGISLSTTLFSWASWWRENVRNVERILYSKI